MTNENLLSDLDNRAATAAQDLRDRAAARPVPAFDERTTIKLAAPPVGRATSVWPTLSIAAALIVLVGAVGWFALGRSGNEVVTASAGDAPRPFVATDLAPGLKPAYYLDPSGEVDGPSPSGPLSLYGPSTDRPMLGLVYLSTFGKTELEGQVSTDYGDRTAYEFGDVGIGQNTVVVPVGTGAVAVLAPSLSREELGAIVRAFTLDDDKVALPDSEVPEGWRFLGSDPGGFGSVSPTIAMRSGIGTAYLAGYSDGDQVSVTVSSGPGTELSAASARLLATDAETLTIRGHDATLVTVPLGTRSADELFSLAWMESPGEVIQVTGYGVSDQYLRSFAEGLEPVGTKAWADLVDQTQLGEFDSGEYSDDSIGYQDLGSGQFADGTAWRLEVGTSTDKDARLSTRLHVAVDQSSDGGSSISSASGSSAGGSDTAFVSNETVDQGGRHFASGILGAEVATIELRRSDGSLIGPAEIVEGAGARAWVTELTEDPTILVALGADGQVLDQVEFSNLDANESPQVSESGPVTTIPDSPGG